MRFEEAYAGWEGGRLRQDEAARLLGICERTFRRYVERYEDRGIEGLIDKRLGQVSGRRAPVDEVLALTDGDRRRHGLEREAFLRLVPQSPSAQGETNIHAPSTAPIPAKPETVPGYGAVLKNFQVQVSRLRIGSPDNSSSIRSGSAGFTK